MYYARKRTYPDLEELRRSIRFRNTFCGSEKNRFHLIPGVDGRYRDDDVDGGYLFRAGVLRNCFGSFADGVLGQFPGQEQTDCSLNFSTCYGGPFVVMSEAGSFCGDAFEYVVHEAVHDAHGFAGDAGVGMHLLQNFVNVDGVAFLPPTFLLLVSLRDVLLRLSGLLRCFTASLGWHLRKLNGTDECLSIRLDKLSYVASTSGGRGANDVPFFRLST